MVELLIRRGADLFAEAGWGRSRTSPILTALAHSHLVSSKLLLDRHKALYPDLSEEDVIPEILGETTQPNIQEDVLAETQSKTKADLQANTQPSTQVDIPAFSQLISARDIPVDPQVDVAESGEDEMSRSYENNKSTKGSQASADSETDFSEESEEDHLQDSVFYRAP
jgi:hypothetical protein